jgi:uncharacterized protein (DUF736 family)
MGLSLRIGAVFLLSSVQLIAQSKGTLSGSVTDAQSGEPLVGVTIQVVEPNLGTATNSSGFYNFKDVPAGTYSVQASYVGYETLVKYNVVVRSGGTPDLNFALKESQTQLEDVVVTVNPFDKLQETPLSIQRLSAEEIATYPGGNNDIAKVVQSLPGVASSVGGFRNDVIIRGGAPNENVYYLDGVEIPNINHFATQGSAGGPVGLLNVSFFEGVTLSTSAFTGRYDNVLSGVLQFDQRNGNDRNFRTNVRVSSSEAALTLEGPLFRKDRQASNTSFIASFRRSYLQFLFRVIGLPFLPDYWDYQYKVSHKLNEHNDLILTGVGSIDNFSVNIPAELDSEQQAALDQVPVIKQRTNTVGATWRRRFKKGEGYMETTVSTNLLNNDFRRYADNVNQQGIQLSNASKEQETKVRYNYTRFVKNWTLSGGFVLQRAHYTNATTDVVNNLRFTTDLSFTRYGLHGQASKKFFGERLGVSLGVRADGNGFMENGSDVLATLSPRLSVSYKIDQQQKWSVNASAGRYYKIPPYTILGFRDNAGTFVNRNTKYIQSDHFVMGLEYLVTPASRISIEGFYKRYHNYPVSLTDSVSLANLGANFEVLGNEPVVSVGLGRTYGVELLYQKKLSNRSYAILAYTLFKSEFTAFNPDNYLPSSWDSGQLITFTGGYRFANDWELSGRVRYVGKTPFAPVDLAATNRQNTYPALLLDYSSFGQQRLKPFNQTDIRLDKKWNFKKWTLNIFLEVQNVFAQQIPEPPVYGLDRDAAGSIIQPQTVIQISNIANDTPLPALGIVIDF